MACWTERINQEIKFLYCKKQKLNEQLYKIHLECADSCNGMWQYIQASINSQLAKGYNFIIVLYINSLQI
jgi:hypothetical protein